MNNQRELQSQIQNSLTRDINEFNSNPQYGQVRELYKQYFPQITQYIKDWGVRGAIENISKIDARLTAMVNEYFHLLQQINTAIHKGILTPSGIK